MNDSRTISCIMLCAAPGSVRLAKSAVRRALISAIGKGHAQEPWCSIFYREVQDDDPRESVSPRWTLFTSQEEWDRLMVAIGAEFTVEAGWSRAPVDCYRD